jgi:hypothetical protein
MVNNNTRKRSSLVAAKPEAPNKTRLKLTSGNERYPRKTQPEYTGLKTLRDNHAHYETTTSYVSIEKQVRLRPTFLM